VTNAQIAADLRRDIERLEPIYSDTGPTSTLKGFAPKLLEHLRAAVEALEGNRTDAIGDAPKQQPRDT
jgi:hypothetical protein